MTEAPSFPPRPAPGTMTGAERLDEVAAILAAGMRRLILKDQVIKSQSAQRVSFTSTGHRSGHGGGEHHRSRRTP